MGHPLTIAGLTPSITPPMTPSITPYLHRRGTMISVMAPDALIAELLLEWKLVARAVDRPTTGTMNDIWIVETASGPVVLRGHRRTDRQRVDFEHMVMDHARALGVPVPTALRTASGQQVTERDGRLFSVFACANGAQVERDALKSGHALALGVMLGKVHRALRLLDVGDAPRPGRGRGHPAALASRLDDLLRRIAERPDPRNEDAWAIARLQSRRYLDRCRDLEWPVEPPSSEQVIHGDYQDSNVFFEAGAVSAVIDWDKG